MLFGTSRSTGELQITSLPQAKVYLNGKYIGQTPICRCYNSQTNNVLASGDYTVSLTPITGKQQPFLEHVSITKGVLTVVDHTFGSLGTSSGSTLELTPANDPSQSGLLITSYPSGASVLFAMLVDKPVREMVFFPTMKPEK